MSTATIRVEDSNRGISITFDFDPPIDGSDKPELLSRRAALKMVELYAKFCGVPDEYSEVYPKHLIAEQSEIAKKERE